MERGLLHVGWLSLHDFPWKLAQFFVYSGLLGPRSFGSKTNDMGREHEIGLDPFPLCLHITQRRKVLGCNLDSFCSPTHLTAPGEQKWYDHLTLVISPGETLCPVAGTWAQFAPCIVWCVFCAVKSGDTVPLSLGKPRDRFSNLPG